MGIIKRIINEQAAAVAESGDPVLFGRWIGRASTANNWGEKDEISEAAGVARDGDPYIAGSFRGALSAVRVMKGEMKLRFEEEEVLLAERYMAERKRIYEAAQNDSLSPEAYCAERCHLAEETEESIRVIIQKLKDSIKGSTESS